jgi:hypothetical protein
MHPLFRACLAAAMLALATMSPPAHAGSGEVQCPYDDLESVLRRSVRQTGAKMGSNRAGFLAVGENGLRAEVAMRPAGCSTEVAVEVKEGHGFRAESRAQEMREALREALSPGSGCATAYRACMAQQKADAAAKESTAQALSATQACLSGVPDLKTASTEEVRKFDESAAKKRCAHAKELLDRSPDPTVSSLVSDATQRVPAVQQAHLLHYHAGECAPKDLVELLSDKFILETDSATLRVARAMDNASSSCSKALELWKRDLPTYGGPKAAPPWLQTVNGGTTLAQLEAWSAKLQKGRAMLAPLAQQAKARLQAEEASRRENCREVCRCKGNGQEVRQGYERSCPSRGEYGCTSWQGRLREESWEHIRTECR